MYRLTLTPRERAAIDWIGGRYAHGHDLFTLLWHDCQRDDNEVDWDDAHRDITFEVPEWASWRILDIVETDNCACLSGSFADKLYDFVAGIV